jgi:hypothetical protein
MSDQPQFACSVPDNGRSAAARGRTVYASQQGQALTEFVVIALALIPLFLLMPVVAKYQDIAHASQMASRYLAFEAMTRNNGMSSWKPVNQLAGEVRRRFFSNSDAAIKTDDTAGNFKANQNMFWRDPKGDALIKDFDSDVTISFGPGHSAGHSGGFSAASDGKPFTEGPFKAYEKLALQAPGIYTANITVAVANLPSEPNTYTKSYDQFRNIGLTMTRHTSLVVDSWSAKDPDQVDSRVGNSVLTFPGKMLASVKPVVDAAVGVVELPKYYPGACFTCGPKLGELEFWHDVVPADRLR